MKSISSQPPISEQGYRDALAAWASGICLVTTAVGEERAGLTVSSFCSVSLKPPTVLASIERQGQTRQLIHQSQSFAVNILRTEQRALAERFAGLRGEGDRFRGAVWYAGERTGAPLLQGALAALECRVLQQHEVGEHTVWIGLVLAAELSLAKAVPLAYHQRQWGCFVADATE